MFERKVAQYSFVEGLGLFDHRFHSGCRASEERTDQFRNATQIANRGLDGTRPFTAVLCVFRQFASNSLGSGLCDARFGDLDLGVRQTEEDA